MYVYKLTDKWREEDGQTICLFTVGHYEPNGGWVAESDFNDQNEAANRVNFLNGGKNNGR